MNAMNPKKTDEVIEVATGVVECDGGGGALGHPKVSLTLENGAITCPYCSRVYTLKAGAKVGGH